MHKHTHTAVSITYFIIVTTFFWTVDQYQQEIIVDSEALTYLQNLVKYYHWLTELSHSNIPVYSKFSCS